MIKKMLVPLFFISITLFWSCAKPEQETPTVPNSTELNPTEQPAPSVGGQPAAQVPAPSAGGQPAEQVPEPPGGQPVEQVPAPQPAPQISFAKDVLPILQKNCAVIGCHVPPNPDGRLDLNSYDNLMKGGGSGKAIISKNSADSLLVKRIEGKIQPRMPNGKAPLLKEEIDKIKQWIDEGAKNN